MEENNDSDDGKEEKKTWENHQIKLNVIQTLLCMEDSP